MAAIRSFLSRKRNAAFFAIVFLSALAVTLPQLIGLVRLALAFRHLPYAERRERLMDFYAPVRRLKREIPENEPVAILLATPGEGDRGVFITSYLYPRPAYFYHPWQYRGDFSPRRPKTIVRIDGRQPQLVRKVTYAELRREEIGDRRVVRDSRPAAELRDDFIVPLVAAVDGAWPHRYTTEALLVSDRDATVTFTLYPAGATKAWTLRANEPLQFNDLVDQSFGTMTRGWLRVHATSPVRAIFWFVNHAYGNAAPLPLFDDALPLPQRVEGGERLWILNAGNATTVRVNGVALTLAPYALWSGPASTTNVVEGDGKVIVFATRKLKEGATDFRFGF